MTSGKLAHISGKVGKTYVYIAPKSLMCDLNCLPSNMTSNCPIVYEVHLSSNYQNSTEDVDT